MTRVEVETLPKEKVKVSATTVARSSEKMKIGLDLYNQRNCDVPSSLLAATHSPGGDSKGEYEAHSKRVPPSVHVFGV